MSDYVAELDAARNALLTKPRRWNFRVKLELCLAVHGGLISFADIEDKLGVPAKEASEWYSSWRRHGPDALRVGVPRRRRAA